jgi:hypothetical protein
VKINYGDRLKSERRQIKEKTMKCIGNILLIVALISVSQIRGQTNHRPKKYKQRPSPAKLVPTDPSVYITFDKFGEFASAARKETYEIIWFRLHNNFRGPISFCYYDLSVSPTGKIGLQYLVEKNLDLSDLATRNNESVPLGMPGGDICDLYSLAPGKTFLFGVLKSHLTRGRNIKVRFFFPWEGPFKNKTGYDPEHFVYFDGSTLF